MRYLFLCESLLHAHLIEDLKKFLFTTHPRSTNESSHSVICPWIGKPIPLAEFDRENILSTSCSSHDGIIFNQKIPTLVAGYTALIAFQDQSVPAWRIIHHARKLGLPILLIQDGFLSFTLNNLADWKKTIGWPLLRPLKLHELQIAAPHLALFLYKHFYNLQFFGHTRPDVCIVHGLSMQDRLKKQFNVSAMIGTPPSLLSSSSILKHKRNSEKKKPHILFLDQPMLKYSRITKRGWNEEYLHLVQKLSNFNTKIKAHPAQWKKSADDIINIIGKESYDTEKKILSPEYLLKFDLVVTVNSTAFITCIQSEIPVIACNLPSALDQLPQFDSPYILTINDQEKLEASINHFSTNGILPTGIMKSQPLDEHFDSDSKHWNIAVTEAFERLKLLAKKIPPIKS